jgi:hypothetical protein
MEIARNPSSDGILPAGFGFEFWLLKLCVDTFKRRGPPYRTHRLNIIAVNEDAPHFHAPCAESIESRSEFQLAVFCIIRRIGFAPV